MRLCGLVCPPAEIDEVLAAKGFNDTRVIPDPANPSRMWLGDTTTAETNDLLARLAKGELLSANGTRFFLNIFKGLSGFRDGFRRNMSSAERSRIAMKYGADDPNRNESGVVYNTSDAPVLVYSFMPQFNDHWGDYGATHPAVQAHATMGRKMLDIVNSARWPRPTPSSSTSSRKRSTPDSNSTVVAPHVVQQDPRRAGRAPAARRPGPVSQSTAAVHRPAMPSSSKFVTV